MSDVMRSTLHQEPNLNVKCWVVYRWGVYHSAGGRRERHQEWLSPMFSTPEKADVAFERIKADTPDVGIFECTAFFHRDRPGDLQHRANYLAKLV